MAIGPNDTSLAIGGTPGAKAIGNDTTVVIGTSSTARVNFPPDAGAKNTIAVALGKGKTVTK